MPGCTDRWLDESMVGMIVAAQFSEFDGQHVVRLGEGWDNEAFLLGGEWVFRFPRRAKRVVWQQREDTILATVVQPLGALVPQVVYRGRASDHFPYPFIGYRLLEGVSADIAHVPLEHLAPQIANLFGRVHRLDASSVPPTPAGWEPASHEELGQEVVTKAPIIRQALPAGLLDKAAAWLAGDAHPPESRFLPRVCHNDICAEHVLVKPDGTIGGLIDWTDAIVTDPAVDFAGLITIAGWPFIRQVLAHYQLLIDSHFAQRLQWLTRTQTLRWLAEAAENQENVERHISWVSRALAPFE